MENLIFLELPLKLLYLSIIQVIIFKTSVFVNFSDLNPDYRFSEANDLISSETKQEPWTPLLGPF